MRSLALLLLAASVGCAAASAHECDVGADCPSGACGADGVCVSPAAADTGVDAIATDATPDVEDDAGEDTSPTDAPTGCTPGHDGTITASEVPLAAGLKATFRVATNAKVSTAGVAKPDGTRAWDLSIAFAGDHDVLVTTRGPDDAWWAPKFPGATYATELSSSSELLGVFRVGTDALSLLGVVSPTDGITKTDLSYSPASPALKFPLSIGASWKTTSTVSGTASGVLSTYTETYDDRVDARGELITPFGTFDVLRVRVLLTRTVGLAVTTTRTFVFVSECFGTVASITSNANELSEEFGTAAEVRRLAP